MPAYEFDRTGAQYFYRASSPILGGASWPISFGAYLRVESTGYRELVRIRNTSNGHSSTLWIRGSGIVSCGQNNATGTEGADAFSVSANTWHRVCGVILTPTDKHIYMDGRIGGTNTIDRTPTGSMNETRIGNDDPGFGPTDDLALAHVVIWRGALQPWEALAYTQGVSPTRIRPHEIVTYQPFQHPSPWDESADLLWTPNGTPVFVDSHIPSVLGEVSKTPKYPRTTMKRKLRYRGRV